MKQLGLAGWTPDRHLPLNLLLDLRYVTTDVGNHQRAYYQDSMRDGCISAYRITESPKARETQATNPLAQGI